MYLRFITTFVNGFNELETGIFQALPYLRDHSLTNDDDKLILKQLGTWFSKNLDAPTFYAKSKGHKHESKCLSWFKDTAHEHLLKIEELVEILERHDLVVQRLTTSKPGYVIFEDEYQVAAVPFRNDVKKVI